MKVLSPRAHAPIDYVLVAVFGLAPSILGFTGIPATLCYAFGIAVLGMSLMTAYPLGVAKIIPFPVHGYIELAAVPLLLASPWLFGFDHLDAPRNLFLVLGAGYAVVYFLTDYRAAERDVRPRIRREPTVTEGPHYSNRPMM